MLRYKIDMKESANGQKVKSVKSNNDRGLKDKHNPEYLKTIEKEEKREVPRNHTSIFHNNEMTKTTIRSQPNDISR